VRVVSLVPSATETLVALGVMPIACTRFCEQDGIATVGGTKDPHIDEIVALAPDLVVVNDEENRIDDFNALRAAGLAVHSMSPRSVSDVGPVISMLAERVQVPVPAPFGGSDWHRFVHRSTVAFAGRVVVLIWRRPWMTMSSGTYGSSLLSVLGWRNAVTAVGDRYPTGSLEQMAGSAPELVLLPDEPYPFADRHVAEVDAAFPTARVALVDGQDVFWWGIRTPDALARLSAADW
jgi:ABC-type Fe3+-hydroxamate transport system substrate-binding protein